MLVVAGLAYTVKADDEDEAETKLLDFLNELTGRKEGLDPDCVVLKIWVSARQDADERVKDIKAKEQEALKNA